MRLIPAVLLLALATPAFADDPGRIEKARADVLTDVYQGELDERPLGDHGGDGWGSGREVRMDPQGRRLDGPDERGGRIDTRDQAQLHDAGPLGSVFSYLIWGIVIVGIVLIVLWIGSEVMKYGGADAEIAVDAKPPSEPDLAVIERPLDDAEELATRGEYREAIHTLLLRTLQELVRTAAVSVKPAMTSREILARVPLLADARDALAGLITAVEITHFGGDDATLDDYLRCRAQFQKFATAFRASGARADHHGLVPTGGRA